MKVIDGEKTECEKCEDELDLKYAVAFEKHNNKQYLKILCEDCLNQIGVPQGYKLERDITYLKR
jgi:hypothetical protein